MAFSAIITGEIRKRHRGTVQVSRSLDIDTRIRNKQEAYEDLITRLIENNELQLESGIHNFKNMIISIT